MDGLFGKGAAIALGAPVGDEVNRNAALRQRRRERFGRKQMTARTAGRTGLPVSVALAARSGLWPNMSGNEVAIAATRGAKSRLARPITALAS